jgi:Fe-S cluster assembly protein SufD
VGFNAETLEKSGQGEPDWLRDRRRTAYAAFERLPMPSRTDEEWRRTDVTGLNPTAYATLEHANGHKQETPDLPDGKK